ncbi:MAG: DUF1573 domain-containing protein [Gemmataceae bacterium]
MFCSRLILLAALCTVAPASAATWAEQMFDSLKKDFGPVPRGPLLQHTFQITNNTKNVVTVSSVRVSCGCVSAVVVKGSLQPGESTQLIANMDTTRFTGVRAVTIFVQFSQPAFEEVRLVVQSDMRADFAITPGALTFGQVKKGTTPTASVTVTFHGHRDARIHKVKSDTNYVQASVTEVRRTEVEVVYRLTAKLRADTPVGRWFTDVWIESSLPGLNAIRVPVNVEVQPALTVTPPILALGTIKLNQEASGRVILRGSIPFKILSIKGQGDGINVAHDDAVKELHLLTIKGTPAQVGKWNHKLTVVTDLKEDAEVEIVLDADVVP